MICSSFLYNQNILLTTGYIVQLFMFFSKKFLRLYFQDIERVLGTGTGCLDSG